MADATTLQTIIDGAKNVVVKATSVSDGTGETAALKVDVSTLSGTPTSVSIDKIYYDISGMAVNVLWDATTDVTAIVLSNGQGTLDFNEFGGLPNNAGSGVTGDILFSTIGAALNDTYSIILHMRKNYA